MITHDSYELIMMFLHLILQIDEVKELIDEQDRRIPAGLEEMLNGLSQASKDFIRAEIR